MVFFASSLMFGGTLYLLYVLEIRQRQQKAALVLASSDAAPAKV